MAKTQTKETVGLSRRPQDQEMGGFLDDVDATINEMRFVTWDYDGELDDEVPALRVTMQPEGEDDERSQHYSAGSADKVEPSPDGLKLLPKEGSNSKGLKKSSKAALFIKSICDSGFDVDLITDKVDCFEGIKVHVNQRPYTGFGSKMGSMIMLVTKVYGEEDEKAPGKGSAAKAGKKGNNVDEKADATILTLLKENKGKIPKSKLSTLVFRSLRKDPDVKAVTEMALDEDYLGGDDRPFDYDGDTLLSK